MTNWTGAMTGVEINEGNVERYEKCMKRFGKFNVGALVTAYADYHSVWMDINVSEKTEENAAIAMEAIFDCIKAMTK